MTRTEIDRSKLQQLTGNTKVQTRRALPFEGLDPDAPADKAFRFTTNAYERALFAYLAGVRGKGESAASLIRQFARERALSELGKAG